MLVVDDALLLLVLAGVADRDIQRAAERREVLTTGTWYWRLARALHDPESVGALSRLMAQLTADQQARAIAAVERLPEGIGLLGPRELVPEMATLPVDRRLNLLAAEATATALMVGAAIVVTTESPLLTDACRQLGIELRLVT